ncbi:MAG: metallophosphoesterase family protein, partial [Planctomycetota bacterium]
MPTTRREFMAGAALAGVLPPSVGAAALLRDDAAPAAARRVLRVGHLTDVHVQPERGAKQGFAAALGRSLSLDDPIEFLLTGGDAIMDAFAADEMRTRTQWDLWQAVLRDHPVPAAHCIGNHDIWGWNRSGSSTTGDEARWGKAWAIDELELPARHYSFDRA